MLLKQSPKILCGHKKENHLTRKSGGFHYCRCLRNGGMRAANTVENVLGSGTKIDHEQNNNKESALETVKTTKKIPLLFVPLIIMKLLIFLTGIAIYENRQDIGFKHKCGFKAAHVFLLQFLCMGNFCICPPTQIYTCMVGW